MANDDDKPPSLKVVSDNPNAHTDRKIVWAKEGSAARTFPIRRSVAADDGSLV